MGCFPAIFTFPFVIRKAPFSYGLAFSLAASRYCLGGGCLGDGGCFLGSGNLLRGDSLLRHAVQDLAHVVGAD